jgi:hypothetical protein
MRKIILISCVKTKAHLKSPARTLYQSDLFRKSLKFAESLPHDVIYVLSAKCGLLELSTEIEPYNETLNHMHIPQIKVWAHQVINQLRDVADLQNDSFTFLAADRYRRYLIPSLTHFDIPMKGLGIGRQLQFLKDKLQ